MTSTQVFSWHDDAGQWIFFCLLAQLFPFHPSLLFFPEAKRRETAAHTQHTHTCGIPLQARRSGPYWPAMLLKSSAVLMCCDLWAVTRPQLCTRDTRRVCQSNHVLSDVNKVQSSQRLASEGGKPSREGGIGSAYLFYTRSDSPWTAPPAAGAFE